MSSRRAVLVALGVAVAALRTPDARAEDKSATVQALFDEGKRLAEQGKMSEACPKFLASYNLEKRVGTLLNLADCYEKTGLTASAWARFVEAASVARRAHQNQRADYAKEHAASLEAILSYVVISVDPSQTDIEVRRDGAVVEPSLYGVAVPVDPGPHKIQATAPGKTAWSAEIALERGAGKKTVAIPALQSPAPVVIEPPRRRLSGRAISGIAMTGAGALALGFGTYFGVSALSRNSSSRAHCTGNACDAEGVDLRSSAIVRGNVSTVFLTVGALAAAGGVVLWLTAPQSSTRISASVVDRGVIVRGTF